MNLNLTTKRLRLTPLTVDDVDVALEMFTDPDVVKYLGDLMTVEDVRTEMPTWTRRGGNGCVGIWCVSDRDSGEKYGSGLLLPLPIDEDDTNYDLVVPGTMPDAEIEIGFSLKKSAWGKGIATEICERLLQFAFEESPLTEIVATLEDENLRSRHVLEKCGLIDEGRMRAYGEDSPRFRITLDAWLARQHTRNM